MNKITFFRIIDLGINIILSNGLHASFINGNVKRVKECHVWSPLPQVPLKRFTLKVLSELNTLTNVTKLNGATAGHALIVNAFKVIEPDFCDTNRITQNDVSPARMRVWRPLPEDVTNMRTGMGLQRAATHPDLDKKWNNTKFKLILYLIHPTYPKAHL